MYPNANWNHDHHTIERIAGTKKRHPRLRIRNFPDLVKSRIDGRNAEEKEQMNRDTAFNATLLLSGTVTRIILPPGAVLYNHDIILLCSCERQRINCESDERPEIVIYRLECIFVIGN